MPAAAVKDGVLYGGRWWHGERKRPLRRPSGFVLVVEKRKADEAREKQQAQEFARTYLTDPFGNTRFM